VINISSVQRNRTVACDFCAWNVGVNIGTWQQMVLRWWKDERNYVGLTGS